MSTLFFYNTRYFRLIALTAATNALRVRVVNRAAVGFVRRRRLRRYSIECAHIERYSAGQQLRQYLAVSALFGRVGQNQVDMRRAVQCARPRDTGRNADRAVKDGTAKAL